MGNARVVAKATLMIRRVCILMVYSNREAQTGTLNNKIQNPDRPIKRCTPYRYIKIDSRGEQGGRMAHYPSDNCYVYSDGTENPSHELVFVVGRSIERSYVGSPAILHFVAAGLGRTNIVVLTGSGGRSSVTIIVLLSVSGDVALCVGALFGAAIVFAVLVI